MNRDNPPAFPRPASKFTETRLFSCPPQDGMTLRDYFAAAALTGMCANPEMTKNGWLITAQMAYWAADAMMEERKKQKEEKHENSNT